MAEWPVRAPTDDELERALTDLGHWLAYPTSGAVPRRVRRRLASAPPRHARRLLPVRWAALAVAALALTVLGAALLLPGLRAAVAARLGLGGVTIEHLTTLPTLGGSGTGGGPPRGARVSLAEAQERVAFRLAVPVLPELAAPDEVYLESWPPDGQVVLVYRAGAATDAVTPAPIALLLAQFRGDPPVGVLGKGLGPDTTVMSVAVNEQPGLWIEGAPHSFFYRDPAGHPRPATERLAGNVLLWQRGELTLRLESSLTREEALRVAASVR